MMNGLGPGRSVSPQGLHPPPLIRRKLKKKVPWPISMCFLYMFLLFCLLLYVSYCPGDSLGLRICYLLKMFVLFVYCLSIGDTFAHAI